MKDFIRHMINLIPHYGTWKRIDVARLKSISP